MSKINNLLSFCCLGYNHAAFIKDNIEAIWNSNYKDIEIIAVDDGSTDNSGEILKEMQSRSPIPMKVIIQKNTGRIGHNFNVALQNAHGRFVSFIALDDVLCSAQIKKCIDQMIEDPHLAFIASSKVSAIDEAGNTIHDFQNPTIDSLNNPTVEDLLELEFNEFHSFYVQGGFFQKSILDEIGGFDEDMTGDDIILRTKIFKFIQMHPDYAFNILREPTVLYRRHGSNISEDGKKLFRIVAEYLQRYWPNRKNPELFVKWAYRAINQLNFSESLNMLALNSKSASCLNDVAIQKKLVKKIKKETSPFRFIFRKERQGNKRIVKILSLITLTYTRNK